MSITSGPIVPPYTGASSTLPPASSLPLPFGSIVLSLSVGRSGGLEFLHQVPEVTRGGMRRSHHQLEQVVVGQQQQLLQRPPFRLAQAFALARPETREDDVQLQQPPAAAPLQPLQCFALHSSRNTDEMDEADERDEGP